MESLNHSKTENNSTIDQSKETIAPLKNADEKVTPEKFGVQHDAEGNIIKIAENAVPPEAWKNQKKAYDDAWENNKNQALEDDV